MLGDIRLDLTMDWDDCHPSNLDDCIASKLADVDHFWADRQPAFAKLLEVKDIICNLSHERDGATDRFQLNQRLLWQLVSEAGQEVQTPLGTMKWVPNLMHQVANRPFLHRVVFLNLEAPHMLVHEEPLPRPVLLLGVGKCPHLSQKEGREPELLPLGALNRVHDECAERAGDDAQHKVANDVRGAGVVDHERKHDAGVQQGTEGAGDGAGEPKHAEKHGHHDGKERHHQRLEQRHRTNVVDNGTLGLHVGRRLGLVAVAIVVHDHGDACRLEHGVEYAPPPQEASGGGTLERLVSAEQHCKPERRVERKSDVGHVLL
mmetsp:Transcript_13271/g.42331  ORF Transcript_13271/g.42331 Transcript_13271/m.42331 type:complete len:318 (+) Transcript_13271:1611-2564(+)